jgi:hypothetical protein
MEVGLCSKSVQQCSDYSTQKSDYTDNEKENFQLMLDKCYLVLRSKYQQNIATNYSTGTCYQQATFSGS